jgi:hypothetical protein
MVVENDPLPVSSRVLTDVINGCFPGSYEFDNITAQLSQMLYSLEHQLQLIFPAFSSLLFYFIFHRFVPFHILPFLSHDFSFSFVLLFDCLKTLLNIKFSQLSKLLSQVSKAHFSGLNRFENNPIRVLFLLHVFNLWQDQLMQAGVRIRIWKFEEIITVKSRYFLFEPLVLQSVQIRIQVQILSVIMIEIYLLSYACIFSEK